MTLFIDCEFDGFGGPLISMAIVSTDGDEWYQVLTDQAKDPWVKENVLPKLYGLPISEQGFRESLASFLRKHRGETIVADFPCDFRYLLEKVTMPGGVCLNVELDMRLIYSLTTNPECPHYALSDARALMKAYMANREAA